MAAPNSTEEFNYAFVAFHLVATLLMIGGPDGGSPTLRS